MKEATLTWHLYVGLGGCFCALFTAALLPTLRFGPRRPRFLLAGLLVLLALYGLGSHLSAVRGFEAMPHLMRVGSTLGMAFMPLLYLYARSLGAPARPLRIRDLWHALPLVLQVLARLPFFLLPADAKRQALGSSTDLFANRIALLLLALGYGIALMRLHRQHEAGLPEAHSRLEGRHLTWLLLLYGSWTLIPVLDLWESLTHRPLLFLPPAGTTSGLLTLATAFLGLLRLEPTHPKASGSPVEELPIRTSALPPEREADILHRIQTLLDREPLHLEPDLSLTDLAGRLRLPPAYVSRALNNGLAQNFFTFINARRVAHAQRLLLEEPQRTVLDVGLASGFSSKSTFNHVFKKLAGQTPSEYRRMASGTS